MNRKNLLLALGCLVAVGATAQNRSTDFHRAIKEVMSPELRKNVEIPTSSDYQILKCDFHIHTVFSDGSVWPTKRVDDAWAEGLDAISITDHIEYRPNMEYLKADFNTPNEIAVPYGAGRGIIVIPGIELTRAKPEGHLNALFIQDGNKIAAIKDGDKAVREANRQGAFVMMNHPAWPNDTSLIETFHSKLIADKQIHGIEVVNENIYNAEAMRWCDSLGLTRLACTDIHGPSTDYRLDISPRPMTLVFAKERSSAAIREALDAGRTLLFVGNYIAGDPTLMQSIVEASLSLKRVAEWDESQLVDVINRSDIPFVLKRGNGTHTLPAHRTLRFVVSKQDITVPVEVVNCVTGDLVPMKTELKF